MTITIFSTTTSISAFDSSCTEPVSARPLGVQGLGTQLGCELLVGFVEVLDDVAAPQHAWAFPESCGCVQ